MRKIRQGKNINVTVIVLTDWQFISLANRDFEVFMTSPTGVHIPMEFTLEGSKVKFTLKKEMQQVLGNYYVSIYEKLGEKGVLRVDDHFLFELVDDPDFDTTGNEYNIVTGSYNDIEILDEVSVKNLLLKLKAYIGEIENSGNDNDDDSEGQTVIAKILTDIEDLKQLYANLEARLSLLEGKSHVSISAEQNTANFYSLIIKSI